MTSLKKTIRYAWLCALLLSACSSPIALVLPADPPEGTPWVAPTQAPSATPTTSPTSRPSTTPTLAPTSLPTLAPSATLIPAATLEAQAAIQADIDQYLGKMVDEGAFNGSALVAQNGQILLSKGYGLADSEKDVLNTPQTRFRIASLTKQFTAMAVLMLQAQGRLEVKERVCRYLADCPADWSKITIQQLLTQTSGIPDLTGFPDFDETYLSLDTPNRIVAYFRNKPLDFEPGEGWAYSNSGYILLGYLIEKLSGQSYESFLQNEILSPLDMGNSGCSQNPQDLAAGYSSPGLQTGAVDLSWLFSAGCLYSTVEDLYRWDQALYTDRLAPQPLLAEMFKPQATLPADNSFTRFGNSYGYGWAIGTQLGRRTEVHAGAISGFSSLIERYPDDKVTIILLSNLDGKDYTEIARQIAGMVFKH